MTRSAKNSLLQQSRAQRGNMLLSVVIALLIAAVLSTGAIRKLIDGANENAGTSQGQMVANINKALGVYITNSDNSYAILTGGTIPGVSNKMAPTVAELQALGYLSGTVNTTPAHGGAYATQIVLLPVGCTGFTCNIASRLWMTTPILDTYTQGLDIKRLGALVSMVGGNAGFSEPQSPSVIRGSGWLLPNPVASTPAGIVMAINGFGAAVDSNYVRIRDTRDPNLLGNVTVQGNITTNQYLGVGGAATFGGACTTDGQIGKTSNGVLLICQGGLWQNVSGIDQIVLPGAACVAGQVGRDTSGMLLTCQGGVYKNVFGQTSAYITAGAACSQSGLMGLDSTGVSYLCRGGFWVSQAKLNPSAVEMARFVVTDGASVSKPTCSTGGVATYDITPLSVSMDLTTAPPYSALQYSASDVGLTWTVAIKLVTPYGSTKSGNTLSISALLKSYCQYAS